MNKKKKWSGRVIKTDESKYLRVLKRMRSDAKLTDWGADEFLMYSYELIILELKNVKVQEHHVQEPRLQLSNGGSL